MELFLAAFIEHILPIVLTVLGGVLLKILSGVAKKHGIKVDSETKLNAEALMRDIVSSGIARAEQHAKQLNKSTEGQMEGGAKLNKAMEFIAAQIQKHKLDELAEEEMKERIESILGFNTLSEIQMDQMNDFTIGGEEDNENFNG